MTSFHDHQPPFEESNASLRESESLSQAFRVHIAIFLLTTAFILSNLLPIQTYHIFDLYLMLSGMIT
jgi:hypothetical protein